MIGEERRSRIMDILRRDEIVKSNVLQRRFKVSGMTIRRDLEKLEQLGWVKRVHGGAVLNRNGSGVILPQGAFEDRMLLSRHEKAAIGKAAASLLRDGQFVFLDSSTTAVYLTRYLKGFVNLTVVTNGVEVLRALAGKPGVDVTILGGNLQRDHNTVEGGFAAEYTERINLDYVFLTCSAFDNAGIYDYGTIGTSTKRAMIRRARKKVVLANSQKYGKRHYFQICTWDEVDALITDRAFPADGVNALKALKVGVMLADND